jgi:hypothetical protein
LSSPAQSDLVETPKFLKKVFISILFCLIGFAILSNRFFLLRQSRFSHSQRPGLHLPFENPVQSHTGGRIILLATAHEGTSDLDQLARGCSENEASFANAIQQHPVFSKSPTTLSLSPPTYILQSALNL